MRQKITPQNGVIFSLHNSRPYQVSFSVETPGDLKLAWPAAGGSFVSPPRPQAPGDSVSRNFWARGVTACSNSRRAASDRSCDLPHAKRPFEGAAIFLGRQKRTGHETMTPVSISDSQALGVDGSVSADQRPRYA
jgi:hypothetical protein